MIILLANFFVDFGRPTATDRMNEMRFTFKLYTMVTTSICSNIVITAAIISQKQMYVLPINYITMYLDAMIIVSFVIAMIMLQDFNKKKNGPFTIQQLMGKQRFQAIGVLMLSIQIGKSMILVFGTMYQSAYFVYANLPSSCILSFTLMQFQMFVVILTIPYMVILYSVAEKEQKMIKMIKLQDDPIYQNMKE